MRSVRCAAKHRLIAAPTKPFASGFRFWFRVLGFGFLVSGFRVALFRFWGFKVFLGKEAYTHPPLNPTHSKEKSKKKKKKKRKKEKEKGKRKKKKRKRQIVKKKEKGEKGKTMEKREKHKGKTKEKKENEKEKKGKKKKCKEGG